jgi:thiamine biosynthesis lipoprotein
LVVKPTLHISKSRHILSAFLCLLLLSCGGPQTQQLAGATMGTSYHLTWTERGNVPDPELVFKGVEDILERINASMSTYRPDSEISRFNQLAVGQWFEVSEDFYLVWVMSESVSSLSGGAYDVTVAPLVNLWGFGPDGVTDMPEQAAIEAALLSVGQSHIEIDVPHRALRKLAPVQLDFSSIAKGYAVDVVALWLEQQGIADYMVEIGGEIRVAGMSPRSSPWRIAVEKPDPMVRAVTVTLEISNLSVATSGDYRNYFEHEGVRYSHSIDPRTGWPVQHDLVSVTVVHENAALADAWATALTVMGTEAALRTALSERLAVYLISRDGEGFRVQKTPAIDAWLR